MTLGSNASDHDEPLAEINVTPLVDVMLVMLAIFLVLAPLMTKAIKVALPKVEAHASVPQRHAVTVSLDVHNKVFVDDKQVEADKIEPLLAQIAARDPQVRVNLRSDRDESFGYVSKVLATIGRAGIAHVSIVTEPAGPRPAR